MLSPLTAPNPNFGSHHCHQAQACKGCHSIEAADGRCGGEVLPDRSDPPACPYSRTIHKPKCPIIKVKPTIIPVAEAKGPAKLPTTLHPTLEVTTKQKKLAKINQEFVVRHFNADMCERCDRLGYSSCQLYLGARAHLKQWARSVQEGGTGLNHPALSKCLTCSEALEMCNHPITWDILRRHWTASRYTKDGLDTSHLPYDTAVGDRGGRSGQAVPRHTIQEVEPPVNEGIVFVFFPPTKHSH